MLKRFLLSLLACVLAAAPAGAAERPEAVAEAFCAARLAGDETALRALFTPDLEKVVAEAERRNATAARATPELQPPLAEGVPYQSFPGALSECTVGTTHVTGGGVVIEIKYALENQANSRWSDRLVIMNLDGGAAIDDILFASFPTDTYRSGLRRVLFDSFDI